MYTEPEEGQVSKSKCPIKHDIQHFAVIAPGLSAGRNEAKARAEE
jgi:hypothetical protein